MPKHLTVDDTADFITSAEVGAVNGIAQLGADGKVPSGQLPASATGSVDSVNGQVGNVALTAASVDAVANADKGVPNGVAQLDSGGHLVAAQVPSTVVTTAQMGAVLGVATLDNQGKLSPSQTPTAPVTSVNNHTGAVALTSVDVGALDLTTRSAPGGVAALDSSTKIPVAQIPSLISQYQATPGALPTKPGMALTAVSSGSNSTQWTEPLTYTAASAGAMPSGVPNGSMCTRTDIKALYEYVSGAWVLLPYTEPWRNLSLASTVRGYKNNDLEWMPQIRRVGAQVFLRGRMELKTGANFPASSAYVLATVPSDCIPLKTADLVGTSTTAASQIGICRYQVAQSDGSGGGGQISFWAGTGPTPNTPWVGFTGFFWVD
jgi:hypothetical protein